MRDIRLYYPNLSSKLVGNKVAIEDDLQVRRLKSLRVTKNKYQFFLANGFGLEAKADLVKWDDRGGLFKLTEFTQIETNQPRHTLCLSIIKQPKLEIAIDQVAQFGFFSEIKLFFPENNRYSEPKFSKNKLARLERIAIGAFTQSFAALLPSISLEPQLDFDAMEDYSQVLIPHLGDYPNIIRTRIDYAKPLALVIGPEGGFSEAELARYAALEKSQFISLADSVLTTELASSFATGILATQVQEQVD